MNRKEQLKYCSVCLNRKFDVQQGIICKLTDQPADFSGSCDQYSVDEIKKKEQGEAVLASLPVEEKIAMLPEEVKRSLRKHQNLSFAVFGGLIVSVFTGVLWAVISVLTKYQIGWMAIGVGLLVGYSVRFFGAGIDKKFGFIGAFLAILGCLLGNLFSQVGFYAAEESLSYFEVLGYLTPLISFEILIESFEAMDLLFYGIAGFEGYKFAFRNVPERIEEEKDYTPQGAALRLPLALISALSIGVFWFLLSQAAEVEKEFYYESGSLMSKGKTFHGLAEGEWEYFYEVGSVGAQGTFSNGKEEGVWRYFDEFGNLSSTKNFHKGLAHGDYEEYYENGVVLQHGSYDLGRMSGTWTNFYDDGKMMHTGSYYLDLPEGEWEFFHVNGERSQRGNFANGEKSGLWQVWDEEGVLTEEAIHIGPEEVEWITFRDSNGVLTVENGNGKLMISHPNGSLAVTGLVKSKKMTGDWIFINEDGQGETVIHYQGGKGLIKKIIDGQGKVLVENGNGKYVSYFESGLEEHVGEYRGGKKEGQWIIYFEGEGKPLMEDSFYKEGMLDGPFTIHHEIGTEAIIGHYHLGKRVGNWRWFSETGDLESEVEFVDGEKDGAQVFYDEQTVIKKEIYKQGKLVDTIVPS